MSAIKVEGCDLCGRKAESMTVVYDSPRRVGGWAYMCHECWRVHSDAKPGKGLCTKWRKHKDGWFYKDHK